MLHNSNNSLPKSYLEAIGFYVSYLNKCNYCVEHHFEGFARLLDDTKKATQFLGVVQNDTLESFFDAKYFGGIILARLLTVEHTKITKATIDDLIALGFSEGEVLEINQLVSYFNYVNRMVVGLGVNTEGYIIGLSPNDSDSPKDWNYS